MPIYEYCCNGCGTQFEVMQRITDAPGAACPECEAQDVKRLLSPTSFSLKGGGWYSDGYSGKSNSRGGKPSSKASPSASSSSSSSSSESSSSSSESSSSSSESSSSGSGKASSSDSSSSD